MDRKSFDNTSPGKKPTKNVNNETSSPLYDDVLGARYIDKDLIIPNDHKLCIYYNTVRSQKKTRPQTIYCNVNYQDMSDKIYSNITGLDSYKDTQYPLYENVEVKPLARNNMHCPPSPVSSSYSELQHTDIYEDDLKDCSSQNSNWYESIYDHINPPSEISYAVSSISQSISTHKHETEFESLTNRFVNSMSINERKKKSNVNKNFFYEGNCIKCNKKVKEGSGCKAMGNMYHVKCFTCTYCGNKLEGLSFYHVDNKPYCKNDYLNKLEKCSICHKPILDRILRATGRPYHSNCFRCVVCSMSLDSIHFTVDTNNQVYCIDDFHKKFAPKCSVCQLPISPVEGEEETIRFVSLDRSFHVQCYKCEDCGTLLKTEAEGRGCYPLDGHVLCKSCNAKRIQILTSFIT